MTPLPWPLLIAVFTAAPVWVLAVARARRWWEGTR